MTLDDCFATLERCAAAGERCPVNQPKGSFPSDRTSKLARQGKIRVEIFRYNWRVVTILVGPHAGKQTAPAPEGTRPYVIIDKNGSRCNGKPLSNHRSTPAPITLRKFSWDRP